MNNYYKVVLIVILIGVLFLTVFSSSLIGDDNSSEEMDAVSNIGVVSDGQVYKTVTIVQKIVHQLI